MSRASTLVMILFKDEKTSRAAINASSIVSNFPCFFIGTRKSHMLKNCSEPGCSTAAQRLRIPEGRFRFSCFFCSGDNLLLIRYRVIRAILSARSRLSNCRRRSSSLRNLFLEMNSRSADSKCPCFSSTSDLVARRVTTRFPIEEIEL